MRGHGPVRLFTDDVATRIIILRMKSFHDGQVVVFEHFGVIRFRGGRLDAVFGHVANKTTFANNNKKVTATTFSEKAS